MKLTQPETMQSERLKNSGAANPASISKSSPSNASQEMKSALRSLLARHLTEYIHSSWEGIYVRVDRLDVLVDLILAVIPDASTHRKALEAALPFLQSEEREWNRHRYR